MIGSVNWFKETVLDFNANLCYAQNEENGCGAKPILLNFSLNLFKCFRNYILDRQ